MDCRRKNFHSVYLKNILAERGDSWAKAFEEESKKKNPISNRRLLVNVQTDVKLHLQFYQFQTDSRQSPSGYVPACLARARRMAREAAITDPE